MDNVQSILNNYYNEYDEDVNKAVSEAIRVTKPGGKIFFAYITNEAVILNYGLKKVI